MATVVLSYAGAAIGTLIGGPIGGMIGRAAGAIAGNMIDQAVFGPGDRAIEGPRLTDLRVMGSSEAAAIPRLWGRMRIAGQVIWATDFEEVENTSTESASSKGGPSTSVTEYEYFANFAVGLCEGVVDRIGRVWADGREIDISAFTWRLHGGDEAQEPDSLIAARIGAGAAPAYRGTAYIVFERMPLKDFGNRLPQLSFEVFRRAGGAASAIRAVNIIPGSTEFGYDPRVVIRKKGPGVTESENAHAGSRSSDWTVSLDDLQTACPNVAAASLIVTWFGTDLRCGHCAIRPGVDDSTKETWPESWAVSGATRGSAYQVSRILGRAAYGGSPSDGSVRRAIADLKARNLAVCFYPFVAMDIPADNALADPYGGAAQPAYPWRGRITCDPAPGRSGTADGSAAADSQIGSFVGAAQPSDFTVTQGEVTYAGPAEWSYRRMVLHYAHLCAAAGGVDAFLIGSELRGLTTLRNAAGFPFVEALIQLASEVKAILPDAKVSYAADWSEYAGFDPANGSGDRIFHLDPLWASAHVDFIAIDNYMPLTDWRDGSAHLDRQEGWPSIRDAAYLRSRFAAGEGFDWYYASAADRAAQIRTPITDGAYGKPWVFRVKDLVSWWSNPHVDRIGGVELSLPTAWVPQSKPFWFTEAGCPAIDKGTNQPNAFVDAKSSESLLPHFSSGRRDDALQSAYFAALYGYWGTPGAHNPISSVYGGPMVAAGRIFAWAWDARPFPAFPARTDVWADGVNHPTGHWLNGRMGAVPLAALIEAICAAYGMDGVETGGVEGLVDGFVIDRVMSARDALEPLLQGLAIDAIESDGTMAFRMRMSDPVAEISPGGFVETEEGAPLYDLTRAQETELPARIKLGYTESGVDYRLATVEAERLKGTSRGERVIELPCAIGQPLAKMRADVMLQEAWAGRERLVFALPPSRLALEPGDVLSFGPRMVRVGAMADGAARRVEALSYEPEVYDPPDAPARGEQASLSVIYGPPEALMMNLAMAPPSAAAHAPWLAAHATPWPGELTLLRKRVGFSAARNLRSRATLGTLIDPLPAGPLDVLDRATIVTVTMQSGALAAAGIDAMLSGANLAAVGDAETGYEIVQFAGAELVGPKTWRLSTFLRGQGGSAPEMRNLRPPGSRLVLLNAAVVQPPVTLAEAALTLTWRLGPSRLDHGDPAYLEFAHRGDPVGLRPLSPCQLRMSRDGGDLIFSWIRRTRIDGDGWEAAEVPLGEETEAYVAEIRSGATLKRRVDLTAPLYRYTAAQQAADFGAAPFAFTFRIAQRSAVYGPGAFLEETFDV